MRARRARAQVAGTDRLGTDASVAGRVDVVQGLDVWRMVDACWSGFVPLRGGRVVTPPSSPLFMQSLHSIDVSWFLAGKVFERKGLRVKSSNERR